jgi:hypothetical protein
MLRLHWSARSVIRRKPEKRENPSWPEIEDALGTVRDGPGWVSIHVLDQSKGLEVTYLNGKRYRSLGEPVNSLQVHADKGYYMLMLGELVDGEHQVRTYNKPSRDTALAGVQVDILGDPWSYNDLCRDFEIVVKIFREFFETGDVSQELMD